MNERVVVAMSGGVDSSVAAMLMAERGFEPVGVFMHSGLAHASPAAAEHAASQLGIEFHVLDASDHFDGLIDAWATEYGRGRTPNPCLVCNRELKFGRLLEFAETLGARRVATGHYARIGAVGGETALLRGADHSKDQSYALFAIRYERLAGIEFPLGELTKVEVRRLAADRGLAAHDREESQEICFAVGDYADLIRERRPDLLRPGPIVDETGREVGRHDGIARFTIGQRKGVGIAFGEPRYVTRIDPETATVTVGPDASLMSPGMVVRDVNWLTGRPPTGQLEAQAKIRYRHAAAPSVLDASGDVVRVRFGEPQRAVTPGQGGVFYAGDRVLGGGWIERALGAGEIDF